MSRLTVEPNPRIDDSFLVTNRIDEWVLVLPTHRGRYCVKCRGMRCPHTEAVRQYAEEVRGR